ncbi:MAG: terminase gpA endonuclease subunit, partial [Bdellovibrionota bacterium]
MGKALRALIPPKPLPLSEWADKNRNLSPETSDQPGPYRTSEVPYLKGPMDATTDPRVWKVVVVKGAQIGATDGIFLNRLGYKIDRAPGSILWGLPTDAKAKKYSKSRVIPMVRDCPAIKGKLAPAKSRDGNNTILHKQFPGGEIVLAGSNSPSNFAGDPVEEFWADDVDRFAPSAGKEGDQLELGEMRTITFRSRRKCIYVSTPTIEGISKIWAQYLASNMGRYFLPCPHCGHYQAIRWGGPKENGGVKWEEKPGGAPPNWKPKDVWYECEKCRGKIYEEQKRGMLAKGEWRFDPSVEFDGTMGFHLPGLLSPFLTWKSVVHKFLKVKSHPEQLQVWVNTVLGEVFREQGESLSEDALASRRRPCAAEVPNEVVLLTSAWDVQEDRLEGEVLGWTEDEQQIGLGYYRFYGDPDFLEGSHGEISPWDEIGLLLQKEWKRADGATLRIAITCVDSGFKKDTVYRFCRRWKARRVFAIFGSPIMGKPMSSKPERLKNHGMIPRYEVGSDTAKTYLLHRLRIVDEKKPGYCSWLEQRGYDAEYFTMLRAEERKITRDRSGRA